MTQISRPDQLNLPLDPAFNAEFDLGFDLSSLGFSTDTEPSSLLSPQTLASSHTSFLDAGFEPRSTPGLQQLQDIEQEFDFDLGAGAKGSSENPNDILQPARSDAKDEDAVIDQPVWEFDEEGEIQPIHHSPTPMPDIHLVSENISAAPFDHRISGVELAQQNDSEQMNDIQIAVSSFISHF